MPNHQPRTRTPDRPYVTADGRTGVRITPQRCCNGCGDPLGDVTDDEMQAAIDGLPLPDTRWECPTCRLDHPGPQLVMLRTGGPAWTLQEARMALPLGMAVVDATVAACCPCSPVYVGIDAGAEAVLAVGQSPTSELVINGHPVTDDTVRAARAAFDGSPVLQQLFDQFDACRLEQQAEFGNAS